MKELDEHDKYQLELIKVRAQIHRLEIRKLELEGSLWVEELRRKYNAPAQAYTFTEKGFVPKNVATMPRVQED